jgi:hypothetical protein
LIILQTFTFTFAVQDIERKHARKNWTIWKIFPEFSERIENLNPSNFVLKWKIKKESEKT